MSIEENELKIATLEEKLLKTDPASIEFQEIQEELNKLRLESYQNLTAWDRVCIARSGKRPKAGALIKRLFTDFIELKGDQYYAEDSSIIAGIGLLDDIPVTVLAQAKGNTVQESIERNFGMTSPEGFRKTLRLAKQAEKFKRPIITIIDTSGAYPGRGAEERGQARAIANNLMEFSKLRVPVIAIVLSEGGSGGALALSVSDYIMMFENAVYSVLSPEGLASILFKDTTNVKEVAEYMKMTSKDLLDFGIVDEIIPEPLGGIKVFSDEFIDWLSQNLKKKIEELRLVTESKLIENRYRKYRKIGGLFKEE